MKPNVVKNWVEKVLIYTNNNISKNYDRNKLITFMIISLFLSSIYFAYAFLARDEYNSVMFMFMFNQLNSRSES
jgi:hypothetical protein